MIFNFTILTNASNSGEVLILSRVYSTDALIVSVKILQVIVIIIFFSLELST